MNQTLPTPKTRLVARLLWRIETGLGNDLSLKSLAASEGVSPFHLIRAFSLVTGRTVKAYVRARRLSEAARQLRSGTDSVLTIALDAGYDSHEGFSRAFRDHFGHTPSKVRANPDLAIQLQDAIAMTNEPISLATPRIEEFPGLTITGIDRKYTFETRARIPGHWEDALATYGAHMFGQETYGVCHSFDGNAFRYLVGYAGNPEDGADHLKIPPGTYAVFKHSGHISTIAGTWSAIFDDWAPKADHVITDGAEIEIYDADFRPEKTGGVSIWIPVSRKDATKA